MKKRVIYALRVLNIFFIALLGVFVFVKFNLPLPWLLGPIFICAIASRFEKVKFHTPYFLGTPSRIILGLTIASSFKPEVFLNFNHYIYSVLLIIPFVIFIAFFGTWYYVRIAKMDKMSAFFSAMPGGLFEMVTLGEERGANTRVITMAQSARLIIIVFFLPFALDIFFNLNLGETSSTTFSFSKVSVWEIFILSTTGVAGWLLASKVKIAGAALIGPMFGGIFVYLVGIVDSKPPEELLHCAQLVLGILIGTSFKSVSKYELLLTLKATFGYMIILSAISISFVFIAYCITAFSPLSIILAFSPGGQSEMLIVAMVISESLLPYVALHHITRTFLIMILAPIFAKWIQKI